ncbi:hypothetical protein TL16_g08771 [Triparma laevis f. inornata]|uniref:SAYSvFN domain-containing protein n=2 Tax=Triparma laevis TaxID=1534972 RepID=A0A9W7FCG2_9STRA|nr:hypothetical protein TL16_g08771 [Triparma laevis f. inornata]GMI09611.1 hypothetical protein TrLO_g6562 [Triparma laevis f. longispina]
MTIFMLVLFYFLFTYGFREAWSSERQTASAYSVFNPGLQEIPGTLSGNKIDSQLRHKKEKEKKRSHFRPLNVEEKEVKEVIKGDERLRRREAQAKAAASRAKKRQEKEGEPS